MHKKFSSLTQHFDFTETDCQLNVIQVHNFMDTNLLEIKINGTTTNKDIHSSEYGCFLVPHMGQIGHIWFRQVIAV